MIDGDAPTRPDDVNREGRSVSARLPRAEFVHWLLVDIPPTVTEIAEGACSDGVVDHGKEVPRGPDGSQKGLNDSPGRLQGDAADRKRVPQGKRVSVLVDLGGRLTIKKHN